MATNLCARNAILFNSSMCACPPGHLLNASTNSCALFRLSASEVWFSSSGVEHSGTGTIFPETIFSFDSIKKFTQSQAVFLEATLILLLCWTLFCVLVRFGRLGDGNTTWFKIRWWISRLDICFATRHWLDDQKVVMKRKTELGGTLSIASWILFIGLFAALLYQIISKRSVEMHNVRAANAPDLANFVNDMELNMTTISGMSCSNLRGFGNLVIGNSGFTEPRITPLSTFANHSCHNTSKGPMISLKCSGCKIIRDDMYISWWFVDIHNNPASAVGFQFNLTSMDQNKRKYVSFVSGTLINGSNLGESAVSFRGTDANIFKFNIFPRIYRNLHDLRLLQPLFYEFLPGSSYSDTRRFQSSLESSRDGLINMTLYVNFLSSYIVEIDNRNILGPVSFLADLGGLYCISIGIFFFFLVQCEYRVKRLRNEDGMMRKIRNQQKAKGNWGKLRKFVSYTWGPRMLDEDSTSTKNHTCCTGVMIESFDQNGSLYKRRLRNRKDSISFNQKVSIPDKKNEIEACIPMDVVNSRSVGTSKFGESLQESRKNREIDSCM